MAEVVSESVSAKIGSDLISILRGWHNLERARDPNARIIDFDFAPPTEVPQFRDRVEVIDRLTGILDEIKPITPVDEFMCARTLSMLTYAEALDGVQYDFVPYVERTIGVTPTLVSETEIEKQYQLASYYFREANQGLPFNPDGWREFMQDAALSNDQIRDTVIAAKTRLEPIIMARLGRTFQTNSEPVFVNKDQPWICRVYGDGNGLHFEVNRHIKTRPRWYKGKPEQLAVHERCAHLIQAKCYEANIQDGVISPVLGLTTIPGPEQFVDEGVADTLAYLVPEIYPELFIYGKLAVELRYLEDLVNNNVHIWLNDPNFSVIEAREFALHYNPSDTSERFDDRIPLRREDKKYRTYLMAYSAGARYFHDLSKRLSENQIDSLLEFVYSRPVTPTQTRAFVAQLVD